VSDTLATLQLKRHEDRRIRAGHLWIFSNEVDTAATPLKPLRAGQTVRIVNDREQFLGFGYVNPGTLIAARIVSRLESQPFDAALIKARLRLAAQMRAALNLGRHHRWVFGESDRLPGLVLDCYGDTVVGQIGTQGMESRQDEITHAVQAAEFGIANLVWKNDGSSRLLENLTREVSSGFGAVPAELTIEESRTVGKLLNFTAPLAEGQKTGWFYDQTDNRAQLARLIQPGARVLDVCSYVGAWAVTALAAGAASVTCVDSSAIALDYAAANAARNGFQLAIERSDAFDALEALAAARQRFDVVILDPPAFVKRKKDLPQGEAAYRKLNQLALRLLDEGGLLVSCSCSYHLPADSLLIAIQTAARHVDRFVQIIAMGAQSRDHPVHPAIVETRYLKAIFARVLRE
jgi:23S rRNA (cytosine1962-C5)-methyltransferase